MGALPPPFPPCGILSYCFVCFGVFAQFVINYKPVNFGRDTKMLTHTAKGSLSFLLGRFVLSTYYMMCRNASLVTFNVKRGRH